MADLNLGPTGGTNPNAAQQLIIRGKLGFDGIKIFHKDGTFTSYSAVDTNASRGAAWLTAHADLATGETMYTPPGDYYLATNFVNLKSCSYYFDYARLYIDGSTAAGGGGAYANWTMWASALTNLVIGGSLILDGGSVAGKYGLVIQNCPGANLSGIIAKNFAVIGFWLAPDGGTKTPSKHLTNCRATGCGTGFKFDAGGEYYTLTSCHADTNTTGFDNGGGNNEFVGCHSTLNGTNIILRNGSNAGHGSWTGGACNHSTTKGLLIKSTFPLGFQFVGSHFFANTGGLDLGGAGVNFDACEIDSAIVCSETQEGIHTFRGCLMPGSSTVISSLTTPQRANIKFYDCNTLTGKFAYNDPVPAPIYTVATLPAVASATYGTCAVTDSLAPAVGVAVSAGGSAKCLVTSNGTNWVVSAVL